jgi:hypothetical protein
MKNLLFVLFILTLSQTVLLLQTSSFLKQEDLAGIAIAESAADAQATSETLNAPVTSGQSGYAIHDESEAHSTENAGSGSMSASASRGDSSENSSMSTNQHSYDASASQDSGMSASSSSMTSVSHDVECTLANDTPAPVRERITEYIEIDVPASNPDPRVCKKKPTPPQPEQVIYGPFYSQDVVTDKTHSTHEHNELVQSGSYEERVEKTFEEEVEKKEDESLSHLIEKQNETINKTKKAKKKQQQLKKIIEVEYRKGKRKNTKYIDELKHQLDKSVDRVEELETEAVLANEVIKEAITEAHTEELRKEQADEFSKEIEKHLDQERYEENEALERLVEINKAERDYNKRLDEINKEQCSAVQRREELNKLTHHVEETKHEIVAELKVKLDNLSKEVQLENDTKARLCEIKKELITDQQNVETIDEEIKHSEERKSERTEEQQRTITRTESEKSEITSEEHRREESSHMAHDVEKRLAEINQRKQLIEKLLMQETETIKRDVKKKKSGKRTLDELAQKKNQLLDYLKSEHVNVEESHSEVEETHDAISDMLKQLESGSFRSLDSSYSAGQESSKHAKLDESSSLTSTTDLEKSAEYNELKSHVSESTLEHTLEEQEREEKFEEIKEESIQIAVADVVAQSVAEDKKAKCETLVEALHNEAAVTAEFENLTTAQ